MMRRKQEQGFIALYLSILVLAILATFGGALFLTSVRQDQISRNLVLSSQAYYASEAGIEDALLRLKQGISWTNPIPLSLVGDSVQTTISNIVGGARTITGEASELLRSKKVQAVYAISSDIPSFFYGAHVGSGGLVMDNQSQVVGNLFSNGSITGNSAAIITGTAQIAGTGNKIGDVTVQQDAYADICDHATVTGGLHANTKTSCTYGSFVTPLSPPITPVPLPITQPQIDDWKQDALAGGITNGDYSQSGSGTASLGPQKIVGNLSVDQSAQLNVTGTLWVTGNIIISNNAVVKLASSYGSASGVIIADGTITLQNNSISRGSGQPGSYLMYLSTSASSSAFSINNNAQADILYTNTGTVTIQNNIRLREVTAYKVHLQNSATITYEVGLQNAAFVSGPGGSYEVTSWKEIE